MKHPTRLLGATLLAVLGWAAYQVTAPAPAPLSSFMPRGAMLYLEAKDFSALLAEWNASQPKREWLKSDNYAVFSRSRLFLRLQEAQQQFAAAAGIPADMKFVEQAAGRQSALGLYDIGKLEFLYVSRHPSGSALQSALWEARTKFETRNAGGISFFVRTDAKTERTVAFAATGEYLVLATREDLLAGALELLAGGKGQRMTEEKWFSTAVAAAAEPGDLRMVLNLEKLAAAPHFSSYWVQRNVGELRQYSAAVSDLHHSGAEYREERVLLPDIGGTAPTGRGAKLRRAGTAEGTQAVAELVRLVPEEYGMYRAMANPTAEESLALLESMILVPRRGPAPAERRAPRAVPSEEAVGSASDLETRIDAAPVAQTAPASGSAALREAIEKAGVQAALQVQSTRRDPAAAFVHVRSALVLLAASPWDAEQVRAALQAAVVPGLTTQQLGVGWQESGEGKLRYFQLDGLMPLRMAVQGKYLVISDDAETLLATLGRMNNAPAMRPADYAAGFHHRREAANFARLTGVLDRSGRGSSESEQRSSREPEFFSQNLAGLSRTLAALKSVSIVTRESNGKLLQTVTYRWER